MIFRLLIKHQIISFWDVRKCLFSALRCYEWLRIANVDVIILVWSVDEYHACSVLHTPASPVQLLSPAELIRIKLLCPGESSGGGWFISDTNHPHTDHWSTKLSVVVIQIRTILTNDLTIGWQNLNLLSHTNATLAPQARQAKASGENLNYMTLLP